MLITEWNMEDAKVVWRREAREDGLAEGRQEGRKAGLTEGREQIMKNLLAMGMSMEQVAQATELPIEKIRALSSE